MRTVVTGAAGFVGSHVAQGLLAAGHEVIAVDALERSSAPGQARANRALLSRQRGVVPVEIDLATGELTRLADADLVIHLAGRPGVRTSWDTPQASVRDNVTATRRLLAACLDARRRPKVVVASSSSVYGSVARPASEDDPLRPESPYARTKLAVEQLTAAAAAEGLETVVLRYFSVYGPRQRPDMAFHRFIEAALADRPINLLGDGSQARAFTHVSDVVAATVLAATTELPTGTVLNVGHPASTTVRTAIGLLATLLDRDIATRQESPARGESSKTWTDGERASRLLGWRPRIDLPVGLADQIEWHRSRQRAHV